MPCVCVVSNILELVPMTDTNNPSRRNNSIRIQSSFNGKMTAVDNQLHGTNHLSKIGRVPSD